MAEIAEYMEQWLEDDDETTLVELQLITRNIGADIPSATIRSHLRVSLQWAVVRTRYGTMISAANQQKRVEFAQCALTTMTTLTTSSGLMNHLKD